MMTNFDMFTIKMSKIGQDKTTHNKVMTLSNLAFLLGHPLEARDCPDGHSSGYQSRAYPTLVTP
jgi:hypothetical protein